jgi:protein-L-isoaspartate(D-aspartate) O-methyltransferase
MNIEQARFNMVEQQIRPWDVLNTQILDVLYQVRREDFVPPAYRTLAFVDMEIPLENGERMLSPKLEARLLQELRLKKSDRVLHVGTGSGYVAALLGHLAAQVTTVELHPGLASTARQRLYDHGFQNVTVAVGDAARGWNPKKHWDVILLTGSVPEMPSSFLEALAPGGCAVAVVGQSPVMSVQRWVRLGNAPVEQETLFETEIPPLHHVAHRDRFQF